MATSRDGRWGFLGEGYDPAGASGRGASGPARRAESSGPRPGRRKGRQPSVPWSSPVGSSAPPRARPAATPGPVATTGGVVGLEPHDGAVLEPHVRAADVVTEPAPVADGAVLELDVHLRALGAHAEVDLDLAAGGLLDLDGPPLLAGVALTRLSWPPAAATVTVPAPAASTTRVPDATAGPAGSVPTVVDVVAVVLVVVGPWTASGGR